MEQTELDFVERLLKLLGLSNCTVYWYDFPFEGNCRIGYVALAGHAVTVNVRLDDGHPSIIGYDVGWPA